MKPRVLIVDDNPINVKLTQATLNFAGYDIATACDAESAQEMIAAAPFDLILMDIELPGMDGLTLTRKIKADPKTKGIVVIALTAFAMKGDLEKALDAGCNGYITKPINTRQFAKQVASFLTSAV